MLKPEHFDKNYAIDFRRYGVRERREFMKMLHNHGMNIFGGSSIINELRDDRNTILSDDDMFILINPMINTLDTSMDKLYVEERYTILNIPAFIPVLRQIMIRGKAFSSRYILNALDEDIYVSVTPEIYHSDAFDGFLNTLNDMGIKWNSGHDLGKDFINEDTHGSLMFCKDYTGAVSSHGDEHPDKTKLSLYGAVEKFRNITAMLGSYYNPYTYHYRNTIDPIEPCWDNMDEEELVIPNDTIGEQEREEDFMLTPEVFDRSFYVNLTGVPRVAREELFQALNKHGFKMLSGMSMVDALSENWTHSTILYLYFDNSLSGIKFIREEERVNSNIDILGIPEFVAKLTQRMMEYPSLFPTGKVISELQHNLQCKIPENVDTTRLRHFVQGLRGSNITWNDGSKVKVEDFTTSTKFLHLYKDNSGFTYQPYEDDIEVKNMGEFIEDIHDAIEVLRGKYNFYHYNYRTATQENDHAEVTVSSRPAQDVTVPTMHISHEEFRQFIKDNLLYNGQTVYSMYHDDEFVITGFITIADYYDIIFEKEDDIITFNFKLKDDRKINLVDFSTNMHYNPRINEVNTRSLSVDPHIKYGYVKKNDIGGQYFVRTKDMNDFLKNCNDNIVPIKSSDMIKESKSRELAEGYDDLYNRYKRWAISEGIEGGDYKFHLTTWT